MGIPTFEITVSRLEIQAFPMNDGDEKRNGSVSLVTGKEKKSPQKRTPYITDVLVLFIFSTYCRISRFLSVDLPSHSPHVESVIPRIKRICNIGVKKI